MASGRYGGGSLMALLSIPTHYYYFQFHLQCYIKHVDSLISEATIVILVLSLHAFFFSLPHSNLVWLWSWVPGALSQKLLDHEADHSHALPRLRFFITLAPLPHISSCCGV
jgi:hypothetical protein